MYGGGYYITGNIVHKFLQYHNKIVIFAARNVNDTFAGKYNYRLDFIYLYKNNQVSLN